MLRAIGAQIEKTTNHEACRDLSGRRMRDLNNEKKIREWVARQAEREREKEERRKARLERRRAVPKHNFSDPNYEHQMSTVSDDIRDSVTVGLQNSASTSAGPSKPRKRKAREEPDFDVKKAGEWLGMDINLEDLSSGSESDSDSAMDSAAECEGQAQGIADESRSEESNGRTVSACTVTSSTNASDQKLMCASTDSQRILENTESKKSEVSDVPAVHGQDAESKKSELSISDQPVAEEKSTSEEVRTKPEIVEIDLDTAPSQEYLESCGLESLKAALLSRGLKCSGTLEDRAQRLWSIKGLAPDQIPKSYYPKPAKGKKK